MVIQILIVKVPKLFANLWRGPLKPRKSAFCHLRAGLACGPRPRSVPERHRVHDAAWPEGEEAGDDGRADKYAEHGVAVPTDAVAARMQDRERQHRQRKDRQEMNRAERADDVEAL